MSSSRSMTFLKILPMTLFRINNGRSIKLRDLAVKKRSSYDVLSQSGILHPLNSTTYAGPNGASMRPFGDTQTELVKSFKGKDVVVYGISENTPLPDNLILVHEHSDHYSLQPAEQMSLEELNHTLTQFFEQNATQYTQEGWLFTFRDGWQWSDEYQDYFRCLDNDSCEWYSAQGGTSSSKSAEKGSKKGKKH